jgi:hypothetical protein
MDATQFKEERMPSTPTRRRLTPSMVIAMAALVAALTGSAIAAKRFLITSTKQIAPSVLAQLKGNAGPAGPQGDPGAAGAKGDAGAAGGTGDAGAKGDTGAAGTNGTNGTNGSNGTSSALTLANETAGANCTAGGTKVTVDSPAQTRYVCNGTNGTSGGTTSSQTVAGEATTTSTSEVALDGPSVTVNVPAGGANVLIGANYDAKGDGTHYAGVSVYEDGTRINGVGANTSASYVRLHGTVSNAADAGSHTFTLRYNSQTGTLASFQNRTLIVTVLG